MRCWVLVTLACACTPGPGYQQREMVTAVAPQDGNSLGTLDNRTVEFVFDGGQIEFELYRAGSRVTQVARNRFAVPMMLRWTLSQLDNLEPASALEGVAFLPPAPIPLGAGPPVVLTELDLVDPTARYHRVIDFKARFGDPRSEPTE